MTPRVVPNPTKHRATDLPARPVLQSRLQGIALGVMLSALVSTPAFAGGADVSADEIYADDVTLTTWDGQPLDINGDGSTDLAVATNRDGPVGRSRYYLGNGDGTFGASVLLAEEASSEIVAADLTGDALIDLIQGRRDETLLLFTGNGTGVNAAVDLHTDTNRVLAVAVGDLDIDGDLDLVAGTGHQGGLPANPLQVNRFYLNDLGTFTGTDIAADLDDTRSIALADIDGDGNLDVIVGNDETTPGSNRIYRNLFDSVTVSFAAGFDFGPADDQTSKILIGDLDNDGDPDIVALNHVSAGSPGVNRFFLNASTVGTLDLGTGNVSTDTDNTAGGVLADFDGDGDLDLAVANLLSGGPTESSRNKLYLNQFIESGTVSFAAGLDISADEQQSREMTAGDLNGDDLPDLVVGNENNIALVSGTARRYLNNGTATPFTVAFTSTPVTVATDAVAYTYDITTTEPDVGETIVITGVTVPAWLTLTDNGDGTASLTGTPATADIAPHDVSLEVSDGGITATQDFTVTVGAVAPVNNPPAFSSTAVVAATADVAYSYSITATDADAGDTLTITAPTVPAWLILTDNGDGTATLTGTPAAADVGDHDVSLQVSDAASATATQDFTVTVTATAPVNNPPTFTSTADVEVTEGTTYTYEVTASDDDDDALEITAPTLPEWLELTDNGDGTATLTGTPAAADVGDHDVSLEVSDSTDTGTQAFTIAVAEATTPPPPPPSGGGGGGGSLGFLTLFALGLIGAARTRRRPV